MVSSAPSPSPHLRLLCPWNCPGQNTGEGSLSLLQRLFPTQGLNPGLPHCRQILYQLSHKGSPRILEWVTYPFSSDLPNPGIELGSPELQADSLPTVSYQGSPKAGNSGPVPEAEDLLEKENGYPLQYSCLKNFMDRATWQAAVCGVAKSRA